MENNNQLQEIMNEVDAVSKRLNELVDKIHDDGLKELAFMLDQAMGPLVGFSLHLYEQIEGPDCWRRVLDETRKSSSDDELNQV